MFKFRRRRNFSFLLLCLRFYIGNGIGLGIKRFGFWFEIYKKFISKYFWVLGLFFLFCKMRMIIFVLEDEMMIYFKKLLLSKLCD